MNLDDAKIGDEVTPDVLGLTSEHVMSPHIVRLLLGVVAIPRMPQIYPDNKVLARQIWDRITYADGLERYYRYRLRSIYGTKEDAAT